MSNASHSGENDPSREDFWSHLRGRRRSWRLPACGHRTCADLSPLMQRLDRALPLPPEAVDAMTEPSARRTAGRADEVEFVP
ncbi:hypothetical protein OHO83_40830 [Streptomyces sp. NBC_00569]|uniref:hypothetical protein n=1 Tax=unclassified Streptomyces TaxID=2593676 RepID=UPI0022533F30|nr:MULTISPECIES: hypothetical protein [unclassified Streptomyces]MCX5435057.1 hypothetical protein [Streptomyces sp. NBC_00063]WUB98157.1 hypothetical protein OHO83_40830 [Streptomyces sp. NBC_00569]